jgi:hypothetical protein
LANAAEALYKRLVEKTSGRVLRSDTGWPAGSYRPAGMTKEALVGTCNDAVMKITEFYIEYELR